MLRIARILSLDVALGACVSSWFVATVVDAPISRVTLLALGIAVWLIYTADHLWDAYRLNHTSHTLRHRFHQQHFQVILLVFLLFSLAGVISLLYLPQAILRFGILLLVGVAVYFLIFQFTSLKQRFPKEVSAAFLYTTGIFLPSLAQLSSYPPELFLLFAQYFGLALANLTLFAWFECQSDQLDFAHSLATQYGKKKTKITAVVSLSIVLSLTIISTVWLSSKPLWPYAQMIFLIMVAVLFAIVIHPEFFGRSERYRWIGDGVFIIPLLLYLTSL
jgi:4-hydroxybenzoate polyprenyltransferase